jgi:hypothetical protein
MPSTSARRRRVDPVTPALAFPRAACPRSTLTWRYNGGAVPPTASFAAALSAVSPSATTTRRKSGSTCVGEAIGQSNVLPVKR